MRNTFVIAFCEASTEDIPLKITSILVCGVCEGVCVHVILHVYACAYFSSNTTPRSRKKIYLKNTASTDILPPKSLY